MAAWRSLPFQSAVSRTARILLYFTLLYFIAVITGLLIAVFKYDVESGFVRCADMLRLKHV
jgi:hypothetical protein